MVKRRFFAGLVVVLAFLLPAGRCMADVTAQLAQADTYAQQEQYEQAKVIYREVITENPGTDAALEAQEKLTMVFVRQKKLSGADAAYQQLISGFARNPGLLRALDHVADAYREVGEYERALSLYEQVVTRWPDSEKAAESQGSAARMYIRLRDYVAASAAVDKLIRDYGGSKEAAKAIDNVGDAYRDVHEYDKAMELYSWVAANSSDVERAVTSQASLVRLYIKAREYVKAQAETEKLISRFGSDAAIAKAIDNIADGYREKGKLNKALELYSWVVANGSDTERVIASHASVVKIHIYNEESDKAEAETEKLISRFGSDAAIAKAIDNIADSYREERMLGKARELYWWVVDNQGQAEHAIQSQVSAVKVCIAMKDDPNTETEVARLLSLFGERDGIAGSVQSVGDEYFKEKRYEKALELYNSVVGSWPLDEDAIEAQIGVVKSHIALGDEEGAQTGIDRLLVDFADDAKLGEAAERIADYYSDSGQPNKSSAASQYFGQWAEGAAAMGAQVGLAMSCIAAGDEPNTTAAIDKLIADYNDLASFAESAFNVATQCFYKCNYAEAIRLWKLVFGREHLLRRHSAEIPYLLATCYERLENYPEAIEYYKEAVTNYSYTKYAYRAPYRLGMLYRRTGDYEQSIYWFGQQSVLFDNEDFSAKALFFRSVIYRLTEEYDKAIADLQEYSRRYPDGISAAIVPLGIGKCYRRVGNKSQAIEALQQGLAKYSDTIYAASYQRELDALQSGGK